MRFKFFGSVAVLAFWASGLSAQTDTPQRTPLWQGFYAGMSPEEVLQEVKKYNNINKPHLSRKPSQYNWVDHSGTELWYMVDYGHKSAFEILRQGVYFRPYFSKEGRLVTMILSVSPHGYPCSSYKLSEHDSAFNYWKTALMEKYPRQIDSLPVENSLDKRAVFTDGSTVAELYMEYKNAQARSTNSSPSLAEIENISRCFEPQYHVDIIYRSRQFYDAIVQKNVQTSRDNVEAFRSEARSGL